MGPRETAARPRRSSRAAPRKAPRAGDAGLEHPVEIDHQVGRLAVGELPEAAQHGAAAGVEERPGEAAHPLAVAEPTPTAPAGARHDEVGVEVELCDLVEVQEAVLRPWPKGGAPV